MSDVVKFEKVTVRAQTAELVRDLSLTIRSGETVVLIGRSGSGKTTTLRLVNHLLAPSSGSVFVDGKSTAEWDPIELRRRIGYVIQETGLFPHFTIAQNVGLVPTLLKWDQHRIDKRIREVMALVGLDTEMAARYPHQLSGGQRQRAGVARALAADPPILLMDEPFGALDPLTRAEIQNEFLSLRKKLSKTVLFVTHDIAEAVLLADRIVLLESGKIVENAATAEFTKSSNPLVQSYLKLLSTKAQTDD